MAGNADKPAVERRALDTSLGEFVLERLKDAIRRGRFQPGRRIREAEVAAWLGVSRTPEGLANRRAADAEAGHQIVLPQHPALLDPAGKHVVAEPVDDLIAETAN